jgi:hypothetical protein
MLGQYQPLSTYHLPSAPILTVPIPNLPVSVAEKAESLRGVGVDTHNRREERSRKRKHPLTNVINIAEKHEECLRILQSPI